MILRYVREALSKKALRLLCLYHRKVPAILVLNKMDTIPKSRRIFDLIRKLTCNRLADGQGEVKISDNDSKWSVKTYVKRKERELAKEKDVVDDKKELTWDNILEVVRTERLSEERVVSLTAGLVGWPGFRDVFTVSALSGDGVEDLR